MRRYLSLLTFAAFITFAPSCSTPNYEEAVKSREVARQAVRQFHEQFNAQQYSVIYNQAHETFKESGPESEASAMFTAMHQKLGVVKEADMNGWLASKRAGGMSVTLDYRTEFTNGSATEQFEYLVIDSKAMLSKYVVTSPLLLAR